MTRPSRMTDLLVATGLLISAGCAGAEPSEVGSTAATDCGRDLVACSTGCCIPLEVDEHGHNFDFEAFDLRTLEHAALEVSLDGNLEYAVFAGADSDGNPTTLYRYPNDVEGALFDNIVPLNDVNARAGQIRIQRDAGEPGNAPDIIWSDAGMAYQQPHTQDGARNSLTPAELQTLAVFGVESTEDDRLHIALAHLDQNRQLSQRDYRVRRVVNFEPVWSQPLMLPLEARAEETQADARVAIAHDPRALRTGYLLSRASGISPAAVRIYRTAEPSREALESDPTAAPILIGEAIDIDLANTELDGARIVALDDGPQVIAENGGLSIIARAELEAADLSTEFRLIELTVDGLGTLQGVAAIAPAPAQWYAGLTNQLDTPAAVWVEGTELVFAYKVYTGDVTWSLRRYVLSSADAGEAFAGAELMDVRIHAGGATALLASDLNTFSVVAPFPRHIQTVEAYCPAQVELAPISRMDSRCQDVETGRYVPTPCCYDACDEAVRTDEDGVCVAPSTCCALAVACEEAFRFDGICVNADRQAMPEACCPMEEPEPPGPVTEYDEQLRAFADASSSSLRMGLLDQQTLRGLTYNLVSWEEFPLEIRQDRSGFDDYLADLSWILELQRELLEVSRSPHDAYEIRNDDGQTIGYASLATVADDETGDIYWGVVQYYSLDFRMIHDDWQEFL